ncbi:hypothetical protein J2741_000703 [Methanolinea mesophila]|uniref:argininosuccinate synthase n=1 Tax=Methanolinea mesophila TaxID=547055 RepID=UPI001AEB3F5D|nr:argininosuccinate synthase [Methanolinea mesophila]MBP1928156.1 hypothetical protein [Methanolinea mesophila]
MNRSRIVLGNRGLFENRVSPARVGKAPFSAPVPSFLAALLFALVLVSAVSGATTSVHIIREDASGAVIAEKTVDYTWMEKNLPVLGDGTTHYYHQGPVFVDGTGERWNPAEDRNVQEKDMGALKGTNLSRLCDLVGGMAPGDTVKVSAADGFSKTFAFRNVYDPSPRQGPLVITWYRADEGYVPDYRTGMRLVFFADTSVNPWGIHAFGNQDWHESADPEYYYYYVQGSERYPTTTGLSVQEVSTITIMEGDDPGTVAGPTPAPLGPAAVLTGIGLSSVLVARRRGQ